MGSPLPAEAAGKEQTPELELSVVIPVYLNADTLAPLARRLNDTLGEGGNEIIFVNDDSPDAARAELDALKREHDNVEAIHLTHNHGQHAAALAGLARARGRWTVVMDADLQDPPESIPGLVARGQLGFDAVFAGRRGRYESRGRLLSSRIFKHALARACDIPLDAGMFVALSRDGVEALLELHGPAPFVPAMIGCAGLRSDSVPVARSRRANGRSGYTSITRLASASRALRWALRKRTGGRRRNGSAHEPPAAAPNAMSAEQRHDHNAGQLRYYADGRKPNMVPRRSRYLDRQVDELLAFAALRPPDRILEVGCGMGRYTLNLADRGLRVDALDLSAPLLERLRGFARPDQDIATHHADIVDPPPELVGQFDGVVGFFVLHHLHDVAASVAAMTRLLAPGGRLAFLEPNAYNPLYYAQMVIRPTMSWEGDRGVTRMRRGPLVDAMRGAGIRDPWFERFGFFPPFVADRAGAIAFERRIERISPLGPVLPFQLVGGRVAEQ